MDRNEFTTVLKEKGQLTVTDSGGYADLYFTAEVQSDDKKFTVLPVYHVIAEHSQWFEANAEFVGFIMNDTFFQTYHPLSKAVFKDEDPKEAMLKEAMLREINKTLHLSAIACLRSRIPDLEHMKQFVSDKIDKIEESRDMKEVLRDCQEMAERAFYKGKSSDSLLPYLGSLEDVSRFLPINDLLHYIHSPEWVEKLTDAYITEHASSLYTAYRCHEVQTTLLKDIETNPAHPCHLIRNISRSIEDQMTVYLDIEKNSIPYTIKVKAESVKDFWLQKRLSVRSFCITAEKKEFGKLFGRSEDIYPKDIVRIRHGKNILFERE